MDNEEKTDEEAYVKSFNLGYSMAKAYPELSNALSKGKSNSPKFKAMQDGRKLLLSEKSKERLPSWLNCDHNRLPTRMLGKDRDRNNEPER